MHLRKKIHPANVNSDAYLIINNGARVLQKKYFEFAGYVSANGINVVTYDYSDMGVSKAVLKTSERSVQQWSAIDMQSIIDDVLNTNPKAKLFVLGHSLGGQIIGLSERSSKLSGIILVATQTGYWKYWPFPLNILNYMAWRIYVPSLLQLCGYFPGGYDKQLSHMPKQAASEWMKWCNSPNYLFDNIPENKRYYDSITCPLLSISFDADVYATKQSVDWLTSRYVNAKVKRKHYVSRKTRYGHSALFERANFKTMGNDVIRFINSSL